MENSIFRKKSLDRVSSPEQLNDYVRVSDPGVWMILVSVIFLLAGVCIWGIFGHLDTVLETVGICEDGRLVCYVSESNIGSVEKGMKITADDKEYIITGISASPVRVDECMDEYAIHVGNMQAGQWVYEVTADTDLDSGTYKTKIVTESISPLYFVLN